MAGLKCVMFDCRTKEENRNYQLQKYSIMKSFATIIFIFASLVAFGQDTTAANIQYPANGSGGLDIALLVGAEDAVFSALLLLLTFFSYLVPGLKKVQSKHVRALAIGLTLVLAFVAYHATSGESFNIAQIVSYVINYIITTSAYDKIFKPAGLKTPRPVEKAE